MSSKVYTTRKIAFVAVILIGILYLSGAYFVFSRQDYDRARNDMRVTLQNIKAQYLEFKKLDTASEAKSLVRMMDKMNQISLRMQDDGHNIAPEQLKVYTEELRMTGIFVMNENGELVSEYNQEKFSYNSFKKEILRKPVLDVAKYPNKLYTKRIVLEDGSYIDIGAHKRNDAPGIIACYYHTPINYIENYNLSLQSVLKGYEKDKDGIVIVSDGYKIVSSNESKLEGTRVDQNPVVMKLREEGHKGDLLSLKASDGKNYFASLDRGRDFYAYVFFPETKVYATRWTKTGEALLVYLIVVCVFFYFLRQSELEHIAKQRELDAKYREQLILAARRAESADNAKTIFLQRMSHDIRTPINGIRGMLEIALQNKNDPSKVQDCHNKIGEASSYLLQLVSEVLDMGKLSAGEIVLERAPMNIAKIGDEVYDLLKGDAEAKDIEVIFHREKIEHNYLLGSPVHLKRILTNVLNNAIKYNKRSGKIILSRKEVKYSDDLVWIEFSCEDTGVGIKKEFLPHIFENFTQDTGDEARTKFMGTGLGMSIVKNLVDKMGGTISVESKEGIGSKFVIRLPFEVDKDKIVEVQAKTPEQVTAKGLHVLVAEDNALNLEIVQFFLQNAGVTYKSVQNGREAVDAFRDSKEQEYDAVLMDIMMPEMDGLEATREIRALEREDAKNVPIIAMTANAFVEDKVKSLEAGMNDHLTKPLQANLLIETLIKYTKTKAEL